LPEKAGERMLVGDIPKHKCYICGKSSVGACIDMQKITGEDGITRYIPRHDSLKTYCRDHEIDPIYYDENGHPVDMRKEKE
jgi:hypothetical protein